MVVLTLRGDRYGRCIRFTRDRRLAPSRSHGSAPSRCRAVPGRGGRVVSAVDRPVVCRQPGRRRVRRALGALDPRRGRILDERGATVMSAIEVLLAVAGFIVTALVVAGMILL